MSNCIKLTANSRTAYREARVVRSFLGLVVLHSDLQHPSDTPDKCVGIHGFVAETYSFDIHALSSKHTGVCRMRTRASVCMER